MNYRNMIEPYLYGNLSPEDEVAFERQLSRDPALVDETSRRLNAGEVLARIPEYRSAVSRRSSSMKGLLFAGLTAALLGLYWWKTRPSEASADNQPPAASTPVIKSEVLTR